MCYQEVKNSNIRDNFTFKTKQILAKRVGYLCSNPNCRRLTVGPSSNEVKSISLGVAAHISAASKKGPRFDPTISHSRRKHITNGIWLCFNCSVLIDRDENNFTSELLINWKSEAERLTSKLIKNRFHTVEELFAQHFEHVDIPRTNQGQFCLSDNKELLLLINNEKLEFKYFPKSKDWDKENNYLDWGNSYYYVLLNLPEKLSENKSNNIVELQRIIDDEGIEGLITRLFDDENTKKGVPTYKQFHEIINHYFGKKIIKHYLQPVGPNIHVTHDKREYIVSTYLGLIDELNSYCGLDALDEIYTMTNKNHWSNIYLDAGIEKSKFIPELLSNWERYWDKKYERIMTQIGKTGHLDSIKEKSWRQFQMFAEGYNEVGDIIEFSYELNDYDLYPLVVYSMLQIFNKDVSFQEYCELEFEYGRWESICLDSINYSTPVFYIKKYED
ncbi:MAG: hypothetical protein WBA74_20865 [Cyclobacteriaceae bacterium]